MSEETLTVKGLREVQRNLYNYSQQLGDKVVLGALRQGANLVRRGVQQLVPIKTGKLKKGFSVARSKIHRGTHSTDMIGVYLTLRKGKTAPFYGRFQNDGWNTHGAQNGLRRVLGRRAVLFTRSAVGNSRTTQRGKTDVPGKHFVQKAFDSNKESALRLIISSADAGAEVLARKVGLK